MKAIDMTGQTHGWLTVLAKALTTSQGLFWMCRCRCGREVVVAGSKLRSGHTKSCGCYRSDPIDRFAESVALTDAGCLEWVGGLNGAGYGQFYVGTSASNRTGKGYAHRWSYEYHVGPIPEGLELDHLCRNPCCVNPDHLEPVTGQENKLRGTSPAALHAVKTHCPAGHPYAGRNLYVYPTKNQRRCRECGRLQKAAKAASAAQARKAA